MRGKIFGWDQATLSVFHLVRTFPSGVCPEMAAMAPAFIRLISLKLFSPWRSRPLYASIAGYEKARSQPSFTSSGSFPKYDRS